MSNRKRRWSQACLVLLFVMLGLPAVSGVAPLAAEPASPHDDALLYLPFITRGGVGLFGTVTESGQPAGGVALKLYRSGPRNQVGATVTAADGTYAFASAAALSGGRTYQVEYANASDPSRLKRWTTASLNSYTAGQAVHMGDFDIANVTLLAPVGGAELPSPFGFQWVKRSLPADNYALFLYRPGFDTPSALSGGSGWVDQMFIASRPPSFSNGVTYGWTLYLMGSEPGEYGINFESGQFCFTFCPTSAAAPGAGMPGLAWLGVGEAK